MQRKLFIMLFLFLFCHLRAVGAQDVAVVKSYILKPFNEIAAEFKHTCQCRVTEYNLAEGEEEAILRKINSARPAAVFAIGAEALSLAERISDMPVIYTMVMNPKNPGPAEGSRLGISMEIPAEKQLEELLNVFPTAKRIGIVYDPRRTSPLFRDALKAAKAMGIKLVSREVYSPKKVIAAISGMQNEIDTFWMLPDLTVVTPENVEFLLLFSLENRIPILTFTEKYVRFGALMSLSPDPLELGRRAGAIAGRVLAGENIRDIHAANANRALLSLNTKAANKLGIKIGSQILNRAYVVNKEPETR